MHSRIYVLYVCLTFAFAAEQHSTCVTPNGETATCIPIHSCTIITQSIAYLDKDAIDFAKRSQCGHDGAPLVCCGTAGHITTPKPLPAPIYQPSQTELLNLPPPGPIDNHLLPDNSLCGLQQLQQKIVGGKVTEINEFPWMVALKYTDEHGKHAGFNCSGTLINQRYVLTAAQCLSIRGLQLKEVRLGEWRFSTTRDCDDDADEESCADPVKDVTIIQTIAHPYYSVRSGNNDIALILLEEKVKYTEYIRPICLPPNDFPPPHPGTIMDIAGWGITEDGSQSDVKLKVQIPMVANDSCRRVFPNYTHVNPNQACAGGEGGKDACNGDSGGPLMRTYVKQDDTYEEQWYQEGIIYRGLGCGRKGIPSLYTRVSRYIHWILNSLKYS